jgi:transcriptional regulator with XRE-family HTH domain
VKHQVDWARVADVLEMACELRDVSLRDVAEEIGISPSGLTRLRQGKHLSADGLASLAAWLFPKNIPTWVVPVDLAGGVVE